MLLFYRTASLEAYENQKQNTEKKKKMIKN